MKDINPVDIVLGGIVGIIAGVTEYHILSEYDKSLMPSIISFVVFVIITILSLFLIYKLRIRGIKK